jgi:hypothetical protein
MFICGLILALIRVGDLSATDYFVNNLSGDDRFDGATSDIQGGGGGPFRSISRALRSVNKGDRIIVAKTGKAYRECLTLQGGRHSGLERRAFQLIGNGATLEGAAQMPARAWEAVEDGIWRYSPPRKSFQMLFRDGRPLQRVVPDKADRRLPALKPLEWCLFERYIYFRPEKGKGPTQYNLSCADLTVGITLYEVRNVIVRDFIIQGFQLDGVNAHDSVFGGQLVGLTCRGNGRSGISIGGASRVVIEKCTIGDNGTAQLRTEGSSHTQLLETQLLDNSAPAIVNEGGKIQRQEPQPAADTCPS